MKKEQLIEALEIIIDALKESKNEVVKNEEPEKVVKEEIKEEVKEEVKEDKIKGSIDVNEEELKQMKYADLKKYASELGISAKGKRDEIIARILSEEVEITVEEPQEEDNIIPFPTNEKSEEIDYLEMAKEATEDMSLDEIKETLEDLGMDSEGKKKDLINRIAKAMEEGLIEIDDDDEVEEDSDDDDSDEIEETNEEDVEEDEDEDSDDDEIEEDTYFDVFDDGANDPEVVDSEERKKAMIKLQSELINDYLNEALQNEDIEEFLKNNLSEDEMEDFEDEECDEMDKFAMYCEFMKRMINDDGERVPMKEPYEITVDGDVYDYCCGHELSETEEGYVCEICGNVYETE